MAADETNDRNDQLFAMEVYLCQLGTLILSGHPDPTETQEWLSSGFEEVLQRRPEIPQHQLESMRSHYDRISNTAALNARAIQAESQK